MRKIEQAIIDIIKVNKVGNYTLSCRDYVEIEKPKQFQVFLWGSLIFGHLAKTDKFYFCCHGYPTDVTKNRINACIFAFTPFYAHLNRKDGQLFYTNEHNTILLDCKAWYAIKKEGTVEEIKDMLSFLENN